MTKWLNYNYLLIIIILLCFIIKLMFNSLFNNEKNLNNDTNNDICIRYYIALFQRSDHRF